MDNNIRKFGYEELSKDLELEIFGLKFNIGINDSYLNDIRDFQKKVNNYGSEDNDLIKDFVNKLLGEGAYNRISDKYKKDLNKDIDVFVWVKIVLFVKNEMEKYFNNYGKNFKNQNREMRRNNKYNRNYNRNRNYRRY